MDLLDISSRGALIASPTCLKPGEREVLILQGEQAVKDGDYVVAFALPDTNRRCS